MAKSKAAKSAKAKVEKSKVSKAKGAKAKVSKTVAPKAAVKMTSKADLKLDSKVSAKVSAKMPASKASGASAKPFMKTGAVKRFSPLDDRILIERTTLPGKTAGGLYIPDSAQEKPTKGRVVAVGRGHRDAKGRVRPCDVKIGDNVLFTAWSGAEIELDGTTYVILREPDLLGVTNA